MNSHRIAAFLFLCAVSLSAAGAEYPDKLALQEALLAGRFDQLEKSLTSLQQRYKSGSDDDQKVAHALSAFESTNPEFAEPLAAWTKRSPNSAMAHTARALYLSHLGWTSRGARYAHKTSEGNFARMRDYFREARSELRKALALDPALSVAYAEEIRLSKADGEPSAWAEALSQYPGSFTVRFSHLFGLQPKWGGSMDEMRRFMATLVVEERNHPSFSTLRGFRDYTLADQHWRDKNYGEALRYYSQAVAGGEHHLYYGGRARAQRKLDHLAEALADINRALALNPQSPALLEDRAEIHADRGDMKLAMADMDLALRLDPLKPSLLRTRGWLFQKSGRPDAALADYQAALQLEPDSARTYHRMGSLESSRKDYRAAGAFYHQGAQLEPDEPMHWYDLASALYQRKQCEVRYALVRYQRACAGSADAYCKPERMNWAERTLRFVKSNPGCAKVTDDTPPEQ